jgi:hypothetical protein
VDWCTGLSGVPPNSVRCTRAVPVPTNHSRENADAILYNSPDCPVCHRTVRWDSGQRLSNAQRSTLIAEIVQHSAQQKSEPQSQRAPDCPVWHRTIQCHKSIYFDIPLSRVSSSTFLYSFKQSIQFGIPLFFLIVVLLLYPNPSDGLSSYSKRNNYCHSSSKESRSRKLSHNFTSNPTLC